MRRIYFLIWDFLFDLLFPRYCIGCKKEGDWICEECLEAIDIIKEPFCPECRKPTEVGEFCENCRSRFALDGIFICANFEDGVLKDAIHQFKYEFVSDIGKTLGRVMAGKLRSVVSSKHHVSWGEELRFDYIVPVPLHEKRKKWRGFNQAEVLAREIIKMHSGTLRFKAGLPSEAFVKEGALNQHIDAKLCVSTGILKRIKNTQPQMELDREGRLGNLKDVFVLGKASESVVNGKGRSTGSPLRGKSILLVDDITTTGATLEECAKVLKENGASSVWGIVLAKGK